MSVLDEFRDAEKRVAQRLKELEPAAAEYRELEAVAKRLGINDGATVRPAPVAKPGSTRRRSARKRTLSAAQAPATQEPAPSGSR